MIDEMYNDIQDSFYYIDPYNVMSYNWKWHPDSLFTTSGSCTSIFLLRQSLSLVMKYWFLAIALSSSSFAGVMSCISMIVPFV